MNEFDKLLETIRKVLGDQIKDARVSHRLADSPACLVSPDDGVTSSMERLMRVMQKDDSIPQKIFEINRDHPLLRTMLKLSKAGRSRRRGCTCWGPGKWPDWCCPAHSAPGCPGTGPG